ncbi:MAG TPA: NAD(P)-dependent oxidoreductase [Thermoplasmata archaeon]|nr:NAD(P)-dependent oxidoreductase [Thermoplasmata archaeon]
MAVRFDGIVRVFVAGGGGFIGSVLVRTLLARGHSVVAYGQTAAKLDALPPEVMRIAGDVRDRTRVASAAKDCDAIAHLALPDASTKFRKSHPIWIEGTRSLLAVAVDRDMRSFALASGAVGTYGHVPGAWVDETAPIQLRNKITRGRGEADDLAMDAARESGLPVSLLRPPLVYGRGGPFAKYFLDYMRRGRYRVVGDGSNYTGFVHVEDCALAYALALERAPRGEEFIVVDDEPITLREASDLIADALGVRRPKSVPPFVASLVVGKVGVELVTESVRLRNAKLKARLGWSPAHPTLREGLRTVVG